MPASLPPHGANMIYATVTKTARPPGPPAKNPGNIAADFIAREYNPACHAVIIPPSGPGFQLFPALRQISGLCRLKSILPGIRFLKF